MVNIGLNLVFQVIALIQQLDTQKSNTKDGRKKLNGQITTLKTPVYPVLTQEKTNEHRTNT